MICNVQNVEKRINRCIFVILLFEYLLMSKLIHKYNVLGGDYKTKKKYYFPIRFPLSNIFDVH